jgi:hypothetical protein
MTSGVSFTACGLVHDAWHPTANNAVPNTIRLRIEYMIKIPFHGILVELADVSPTYIVFFLVRRIAERIAHRLFLPLLGRQRPRGRF